MWRAHVQGMGLGMGACFMQRLQVQAEGICDNTMWELLGRCQTYIFQRMRHCAYFKCADITRQVAIRVVYMYVRSTCQLPRMPTMRGCDHDWLSTPCLYIHPSTHRGGHPLSTQHSAPLVAPYSPISSRHCH